MVSILRAAKLITHVFLALPAVKGTCVTVPYLLDPVSWSCWCPQPSSHSFSEDLEQLQLSIFSFLLNIIVMWQVYSTQFHFLVGSIMILGVKIIQSTVQCITLYIT